MVHAISLGGQWVGEAISAANITIAPMPRSVFPASAPVNLQDIIMASVSIMPVIIADKRPINSVFIVSL